MPTNSQASPTFSRPNRASHTCSSTTTSRLPDGFVSFVRTGIWVLGIVLPPLARRPRVDLIIDHSVQADFFGAKDVYERNLEREYERNRERYALLRWAGQAFKTFRVVPPGAGICHQVNLERLAQVVVVRDGVAMPDTLFGADSHTTMVNGLGVLGWGVGGIEAEAAMLGQPTYLPWPVVVGVKLKGQLPVGTTATDLVLTLTELFRKKGVARVMQVTKLLRRAAEPLDPTPKCERLLGDEQRPKGPRIVHGPET